MHFIPDVNLSTDRHANFNLLRRERADWVFNRDPEREVQGTAKEIGQILCNMDHILDHFPGNLPRPDISLEAARHIVSLTYS